MLLSCYIMKNRRNISPFSPAFFRPRMSHDVSLLWPWVCHRTKKNLGQVKDPKNHVPWHVSQDNEINKSRVYESWWSQFYLDLTGYFMGSKYIYIYITIRTNMISYGFVWKWLYTPILHWLALGLNMTVVHNDCLGNVTVLRRKHSSCFRKGTSSAASRRLKQKWARPICKQ